MLHHFVCWYVKCVEKVPFRKSGHIYCYVVQQKINVNPLVLEEFVNGKSVDNNNILRKIEEALGM